jgi:hypothetical protein
VGSQAGQLWPSRVNSESESPLLTLLLQINKIIPVYLFNYLERESWKAPFTFTFHLWGGVKGGALTRLNARG